MIEKGRVVASRYEILECLGTGGMGAVYRARDRVLQEDVALKVLRPELDEDEEMGRRFLAEIKLARKVSHPNVCRIHEYGQDGNLRFISMELVDGVDLRRLVSSSQGLPVQEALDLAIQAADGLQAIHDVGIVHRDLKTPNLMRDRNGRVRLMDFGIAKQARGPAAASLTATGMILGTPEYMSPEQAGAGKVDERSDIYALGVVLFEMLTGHVPFHGETPMATALKQIQEAPPLEGPAAAGIPEDLLPLIRQTLEKDPAARYQTAREMSAAMAAVREHFGAAPKAPIGPAVGGASPTLVESALETQQAQPTWHDATRSTGGLEARLLDAALVEGGSPPTDVRPQIRRGVTFVAGDVIAGPLPHRALRRAGRDGRGLRSRGPRARRQGRAQDGRPEIAGQKRRRIERFKREIQLARRSPTRTSAASSTWAAIRPADGDRRDVPHHGAADGRDALRAASGPAGASRPAEALPLATQMARGARRGSRGRRRAPGLQELERDAGPDRGAGERAVVTDFGLARAHGPRRARRAALTGTGDVVGTPAYMAPEQVAGEPDRPGHRRLRARRRALRDGDRRAGRSSATRR